MRDKKTNEFLNAACIYACTAGVYIDALCSRRRRQALVFKKRYAHKCVINEGCLCKFFCPYILMTKLLTWSAGTTGKITNCFNFVLFTRVV